MRGGAAAGEEDAGRVRGQLQTGPAEDGQAGLHLVRGGLLPRRRGHREYQLPINQQYSTAHHSVPGPVPVVVPDGLHQRQDEDEANPVAGRGHGPQVPADKGVNPDSKSIQ